MDKVELIDKINLFKKKIHSLHRELGCFSEKKFDDYNTIDHDFLNGIEDLENNFKKLRDALYEIVWRKYDQNRIDK